MCLSLVVSVSVYSVSSCVCFDVSVLKVEFPSCTGVLGLLGFSCVSVCVCFCERAQIYMSVSSCVYFAVSVLKVEFPSCTALSSFCFPHSCVFVLLRVILEKIDSRIGRFGLLYEWRRKAEKKKHRPVKFSVYDIPCVIKKKQYRGIRT